MGTWSWSGSVSWNRPNAVSKRNRHYQMHKSLSLQTNYTLAIFMTAVVAACITFGGDLSATAVGAFGICGLIGGILQGRAIRSAPERFLEAQSWPAVRSRLMNSWSGRFSMSLILLNGVGLLCLILREPSASFATILACYAAFMSAREFAAIPALHFLKSARSADNVI